MSTQVPREQAGRDPIPAAETRRPRALPHSRTPVSEQEERTAPIRVVLAEDSYVIREFLTMALSGAPEVELLAVCCNGKELETAIGNWHPDVVLTDIRMPPSGADEGLRVAARLERPTLKSVWWC